MPRTSAGILVYRRREGRLEVLLVHPGGPFFAGKDAGYWSIPKGELDPGETELLATARREFEEETGTPVPDGPLIPLDSIHQKSGKIVHAWAVEGDLDTSAMHSNLIEFSVPLVGRRSWPEVDQWRYCGRNEAARRMKDTQLPLLDRLEQALARGEGRSRDAGDDPAGPSR
jgi:predicted NUDIX family NTP pyrophosphohydrolase